MTDITPEAGQGDSPSTEAAPDVDAAAAPAKKAARKRAPRKKAAAAPQAPADAAETEQPAEVPSDAPAEDAPAAPAKKAARKRAPRKKAAAAAQPEQLDLEAAASTAVGDTAVAPAPDVVPPAEPEQVEEPDDATERPGVAVLFQAPEPVKTPRRRRRAQAPEGPPAPEPAQDDATAGTTSETPAEPADTTAETTPDQPAEEPSEGGRKRRRRGGRGRKGRGGEESSEQNGETPADDKQGQQADDKAGDKAGDKAEGDAGSKAEQGEGGDEEGGSASSRRRRRRRRRAGSGDDTHEDEPGTVTKVRQPRKAEDEVASVKGSTRLEAKKQRRRDGREAGRRKPVITEAEFLARRESVERTMIVREREGRTQIAVLEDDVLVEHYVANETNASMIGNVYLGRVQNVLPSMEAAFIDIGKGRNAVLYAGEVNWDAAGLEGQPRRIEAALKSGDQVLVQVTKDPMGHKGARLTSQISLPGRYLVYVPNGSMTGISRKLPDTERSRLKKILKAVVPEHAGVIVRTAAEGASEEELQRDVERLTAQWADIEKKASSSAGGSAPKLLHGEPDLTVRVIRDVFNEDFASLVVSGRSAWDVVQPYLQSVAPDLAERASRWTSEDDVFAAHRVDEQLAKAMDRKVWLPSGGSLVIDRTEAMTVVDVNTGKFTGSGGNLEETVTRNNLEAAEEIVRQLRLRDIGGII
ncbi:MAG TPA: Rne/Rng family ribonuclease, partial [Angustibacter sp.]|nr:Rne/Rng family ribonuclease [Angustibacter sp.]